MATQNFSTYTEVDVAANVVAIDSAAQCSATSIDRDEAAYIYKDFGASHFAGDFEHLFECQVSSGSGNAGFVYLDGLANAVGGLGAIDGAGGTWISPVFVYSTSPDYLLYLRECDAGTLYQDTSSISASTSYYCKHVRTEGAPSTVTLYIYTDAARTNLHDTLSLNLNQADTDYRYLYAIAGSNDGAGSRLLSGYIKDLDLQEAAAGNPWYYYAQQ